MFVLMCVVVLMLLVLMVVSVFSRVMVKFLGLLVFVVVCLVVIV